jgi:hypothetical protein
MSTKKTLKNYIVCPRSIADDYRDGQLSKPERNLLSWLRLSGDPYGKAVVTLEGLSCDTFNQCVTKNYINKTLLSLKSKRYIWYSDRTGRRGSFDVHMGDWILPDGSIKTLDKYFRPTRVTASANIETTDESEVNDEVDDTSQRLQRDFNRKSKGQTIKSINSVLRGYDKDTYKEKDNELSRYSSEKKRDYRTDKFIPRTLEEQKCQELAKKVGDKTVCFNINIYNKYGYRVLEQSEEDFSIYNGEEKDNPPAFFNHLVQERIKLNSHVTDDQTYATCH